MKTAFFIILGFYIMAILVTPILMRLPAQKRRYARMDDRKLVEASTYARTAKRAFLAGSLLTVLCTILLAIVGRTLESGLVPIQALMFLGFVGCLAGRFMMHAIEVATTVEMDFRKFHAEKQSGYSDSNTGGVPTT